MHVRLSSGTRGLEIVPTLHVRAAKALIRLHFSTGWSEPPLLAYVISTKVLCAGSICGSLGANCSMSVY